MTMKTLLIVIVSICAGLGLGAFYQHSNKPAPVTPPYTNCKQASSWQMTDWNIKCADGYEYSRIEPESEQEKQQNEDEARIAYEKGKTEWFAKNPPVKLLFDANRGYDTEYVIQYLKENPIAGDCALIWLKDVVCSDFGDKIYFPTSRY